NDHLDPAEGHGELFGHQLLLHGPESLSEIAFAGIRGDGSVGRDRDPGVDLVRGDRALGLRVHLPAASHAEANDQSARALQKAATRESRILQGRRCVWSHWCHAFTPCPYRTSAFTIRVCAWQRQINPFKAPKISSAVAFGC